MTDLPPIPPLAELDRGDLDNERIPTLIAAVMASDDDLFPLLSSPTWLEDHVRIRPSDDEQFLLVSVAGREVTSIHYSRLVRWMPLALDTDPPIAFDVGDGVA